MPLLQWGAAHPTRGVWCPLTPGFLPPGQEVGRRLGDAFSPRLRGRVVRTTLYCAEGAVAQTNIARFGFRGPAMGKGVRWAARVTMFPALVTVR